MSVAENDSLLKTLDENENPPLLAFNMTVTDTNICNNLNNSNSFEKNDSNGSEVSETKSQLMDISDKILNKSNDSSFCALADVSSEADTKGNVFSSPVKDLMNMSASEFNAFSNGVIFDDSSHPSDCLDDFKHPDVLKQSSDDINNKCSFDGNDFSENNGANVEGEEFQDAVQFFKDPSSMQFLESLQSSEQTQACFPRDSLYMTFDPLHKKFMQPSNSVVPVEKVEISDKSSELTEDDNLENKASEPVKPLSSVPPRESFGNILLSFDSPLKSNSARNSSKSQIPDPENVPRLYTEEELQQALKINELTLHEEFLKRQKEMEEEALKKDQEWNEKLSQCNKLNQAFHTILPEFAIILSELETQNGLLSNKIANLELEKQKLVEDLKTSTDDLQSVEHTFSDFHKRYVQCKDMLKTYKDNEDHLKSEMENLHNQLEEQRQENNSLQLKMKEMADKANAEIANAKKGGEVQVAVLKAQLKKSELKVSSLESDLKQVKIENDKLSSICDDLMAKVSES